MATSQPAEILQIIFQKLSVPDIQSTRLVCKTFAQHANRYLIPRVFIDYRESVLETLVSISESIQLAPYVQTVVVGCFEVESYTFEDYVDFVVLCNDPFSIWTQEDLQNAYITHQLAYKYQKELKDSGRYKDLVVQAMRRMPNIRHIDFGNGKGHALPCRPQSSPFMRHAFETILEATNSRQMSSFMCKRTEISNQYLSMGELWSAPSTIEAFKTLRTVHLCVSREEKSQHVGRLISALEHVEELGLNICAQFPKEMSECHLKRLKILRLENIILDTTSFGPFIRRHKSILEQVHFEGTRATKLCWENIFQELQTLSRRELESERFLRSISFTTLRDTRGVPLWGIGPLERSPEHAFERWGGGRRYRMSSILVVIALEMV
jgi:hypothetical protein